MRAISKLVLGVAAGAMVSYLSGCSEPIGGSLESGSGGRATEGSGGTQGTGGATGSGGVQGTGGTIETGGTTGVGGSTTGTGGRTGAGGTVTGTGGTATGTGGTVTGTGGTATGPGGSTTGPGGRTGLGGRTGPGGRTGTGGVATGTGGSTGGPGGSTGGPGGSTGSPGKHKKFFGNIDTGNSIRSDFKTMWDQFSEENAGKWGSVQSNSQSSFNWGSLDKMYQYCNDNNIVFKEHCFTWGAQQPGFVTSSNATEAFQNWATEFCKRFPKVAVIDVVNEPLHNRAQYISGLGGTGTSGYDWIVNALKYAKAACPNAVLVVNEYNTIEYSGENGNIIKLAKAVLAAGGPLEAIGCQAHDIAKVSSSTLKTYAEKIIAETGLPLYITEMDIGVADDNQQAQMMKDFVTPLWANEKVLGFTYWGYIVGRTWRSNTGLMTDAGAKRPALTWLLSFLGR